MAIEQIVVLMVKMLNEFVKEPKDYEEELQNAIRLFMTQLIHNYKC